MHKRSLKFIGVAFILLAFLVGCALFQKPPDDPNAKNAWIQQSKDGLNLGMEGETAAYVLFGVLCASGTIPAPTCVLGAPADKIWQDDYTAAMGALDQYQAGTITQAQARVAVEKAMLTSLRDALALFNRNTMVKDKALKMRGAPMRK